MKIIISPNFTKQLDKLPDSTLKRINKGLSNLAAETANLDIKKLKPGPEYRLRVGDYRIIFEYVTLESESSILLHNIFHRKDAYKKRG